MDQIRLRLSWRIAILVICILGNEQYAEAKFTPYWKIADNTTVWKSNVHTRAGKRITKFNKLKTKGGKKVFAAREMPNAYAMMVIIGIIVLALGLLGILTWLGLLFAMNLSWLLWSGICASILAVLLLLISSWFYFT